MVWRAAVLGVLLLRQEPEPPAVTLQREVERHWSATKDEEVRQRLGRVRAMLRQRAHEALFGDAEDPDQEVARFYEIGHIVGLLADQAVEGYWDAPLTPNLGGATFVLDEPREPGLGMEGLVDLLKESVAPGTWEGDQTIESTPGGQLLIVAKSRVHRQVSRFLQIQESEAARQVRATVWFFAVPATDAAGLTAGGDGAVSEQTLAGLLKPAQEGGRARRVAGFELSGRLEQLISAFAGRDAAYVTGLDGRVPQRAVVKDGAAVELRAVPTTGGYKVHARLGFRKLLGVEEIATPRGTLELPRLAEVQCTEDLRVPEGKPVILGRLGPLPPEAGLPPVVVVLARFAAR